MPIEVKHVQDGVGVVVSGWGHVRSDEFVDALVEHFHEAPEVFQKHRYALCDYGPVDRVGVSFAAVRAVTAEAKRAAESHRELIVAVVAPNDLIYGLTRMFELLTDGPWEQRTFRRRPEAEAWLRRRCDERFGLSNIVFDAPARPSLVG